MKLFDLPGIWWLILKLVVVAIAGSALFAVSVAGMAMFLVGDVWRAVAAGKYTMAVSAPVLLALGAVWIVIRWRAVSAEEDTGDLR